MAEAVGIEVVYPARQIVGFAHSVLSFDGFGVIGASCVVPKVA